MEHYKKCSLDKFNAQRGIVGNSHEPFYSIKSFQVKEMEEDTFCIIFDDISSSPIKLNNTRLVECIGFDNGKFTITLIKKNGSNITLNVESHKPKLPINDFSVCMICTEDQMYIDFLQNAINHYRSNFPNAELCLVYFGENIPNFAKNIKHLQFKKSQFGMAFAKNKSIEMCTKPHALRMDLDCLLTKQNFKELNSKYETIHHHGIINLKKPTNLYPGNGLYFGETEIFKKVPFNEEFEKYWFEDTELLMNFSRVGIVPYTFFINFQYTDHRRDITTNKLVLRKNQTLFNKIFLQGHR